MKLPYPVLKSPNLQYYQDRFTPTGNWDRSIRENVWRRHQDESNKELSGWEPGSHRRRLMHFRDRYGMVGNDFCLLEAYIFLHVKAPRNEVLEYQGRIRDYWKGNSDLKLKFVRQDVHPADTEAGRHTPSDYCNLDVWVSNVEQPASVIDKPWRILKTGIRKRVPKGNPTLITQVDLKNFFPAQVELGCGPSIEAGIPPLNFFHKLFSLHKDGRFVLDALEDTFLDYFRDPEAWYEKAVVMHRQCLAATPTSFYHTLKSLHDAGHLVGPVFNNNFDGLPISVGMKEYPLRQHDETGFYPAYPFDPEAKSLLVVGSHADRRQCQEHARARGMKIVFIDPEGYEQDDKFVSYPIESPQDGDFLLRCKASELDYKSII